MKSASFISHLPYLSILKPLFLSLPPLPLGTINFFQLSPLSLWLVRMSINTSTLPYLRYLRYLRYLSQVHVTKGMHAQGKEKYTVCRYAGM